MLSPLLAARLLEWYDKNRRDLAFRDDPDPYRIWVSEVMAQQTRIEAMLEKYERFVERFPDVESLAGAGEDDVMKAWEGLGYYTRARMLHRGARQVVELHEGRLPSTKEELLSIAGIGDYIASAVASIAFGENRAAIDANAIRVFSRILEDGSDFSIPKNRSLLAERVEEIIPEGMAGDFNQAIMDLGSMVCLPRNPGCLICPLYEDCQGAAHGSQDLYPRKKEKKKRPVEKKTIIVWVNEKEGKIRLIRRKDGLLRGLYGFDEKVPETETERISLKPVRHVFTHREWDMEGFLVFTEEDDEEFVLLEEAGNLAIPSAFAPFMKEVMEILHERHSSSNH